MLKYFSSVTFAWIGLFLFFSKVGRKYLFRFRETFKSGNIHLEFTEPLKPRHVVFFVFFFIIGSDFNSSTLSPLPKSINSRIYCEWKVFRSYDAYARDIHELQVFYLNSSIKCSPFAVEEKLGTKNSNNYHITFVVPRQSQ